jgi:hypothetical protein
MKTLAAKDPLWWDRHFDCLGRRIRADVRMAAHEIWNHAQASTHAILGDDCDAGDVMEVSVEAVSQYLDRRRIQPFSINIAGLLTIAFRRQLQKRWLRRGLEPRLPPMKPLRPLPVGRPCLNKNGFSSPEAGSNFAIPASHQSLSRLPWQGF